MDLELNEKVVIVTGGASGLGEAMARGFASQGAVVVIADIQEEQAQDLAQKLTKKGARASAVRLDVRSQDSISKMVDFALENFGRIDVLCNNAGVNVRKLAVDVTNAIGIK